MFIAGFKAHICYLTFAVLFSVYEILQVRQGLWIGDFWEHAAVISELSQHPFHPSNPILLSDQDHSFFSPYGLVLGLTSRLFEISSVQTLELVAIINLFLFLITFRFFCGAIFRDHADLSSAIALVLVLFFWGQQADKWSGFFHLSTFHFGLPYPSTFCTALGFYLLGWWWKRNDCTMWLCILPALTFILLSHPPTWLWVCVAFFTASFFHPAKNTSRYLIISATMGLSFLFGLIWPYFDLWVLLKGENTLFHAQSEELYHLTGIKYWPFLTLPFVFFLGRKNFPVDWLSTTGLLMMVIYVGGYITTNYGAGRIISACGIFMQLLIGFQVPYLFLKDLKGKVLVICMCATLLITTFKNISAEKHMLNVFRSIDKTYYTRYYFLQRYAKDSLVLSDPFSNTFLPSLGIRVITWGHPLYNMADQIELNREISEFYDPNETTAEQLNFLKKYNASFLLIDTANTLKNKDQLLTQLNAKLITYANGLNLYKLKNDCP